MKLALSKLGGFVCVCLLTVSLAGSSFLTSRLVQSTDLNINLEKLPHEFGDWKGEDTDKLSERSHDILRLDQYVRRAYTNSKGQSIFVYIGYWKKQSGDYQAAKHSPLMCLPANGWKISQPEVRSIPYSSGEGQQTHLVRRVHGTLRDSNVMFYYWFFSGEKTYLDETEALFSIIKETLLYARSDGGIVEISADITPADSTEREEKNAEEILSSFVKDFYPALVEQMKKNDAKSAKVGA